MEYYIYNNLNDITYLSELIPPLLAFTRKQGGGLIHTATYVHLRSISCVFIKNENN